MSITNPLFAVGLLPLQLPTAIATERLHLHLNMLFSINQARCLHIAMLVTIVPGPEADEDFSPILTPAVDAVQELDLIGS